MKIAFFEIERWEEPILKEQLRGHELFFSARPLGKSDLKKVKDFDILSVFIYSYLKKEMLSSFTKLKLITTRSTGFDHIDTEECKKRKIAVANVPTYGENTVAEHTFALLLALSRKIIESVGRTRRGNFDLEGLRGFDLKGKTLGVIGCGNIGRHVVRIAKGFEMNVLVFDVKPDTAFAKLHGFRYVPMNNLLAESDIVTLHAPLNTHTFHLLNAQNMKLLKKGALLINTARGGLIETDALVQALKKKHLAGVALDVLEEECEIREERQLLSSHFKQHTANKCDIQVALENHILLAQDNVIITPHNAFNSNEALMRILETDLANIRGFLKKDKLNLVN